MGATACLLSLFMSGLALAAHAAGPWHVDGMPWQLSTSSTAVAVWPDVADYDTVIALASLSYNAYLEPGSPEWLPVEGFNLTAAFGWNSTQLQAHAYLAQPANQSEGELVIISFKGTTFPFFDGSNSTADSDKLMDNLMFSCCCASVTPQWTPVCGCFAGERLSPWTQTNICSAPCLNSTYRDPATLSYLAMALQIEKTVAAMFPNAAGTWYTGHSLGGSVAALLSLVTTRPAVTYEAPGERLYAQRLGLWTHPGNLLPIYHFGVASDPIFTGECNGRVSTCALSGFAMETKCHLGHECRYASSAIVSVNEHRLGLVLEKYIRPNSIPPACMPLDDRLCTDCGAWSF